MRARRGFRNTAGTCIINPYGEFHASLRKIYTRKVARKECAYIYTPADLLGLSTAAAAQDWSTFPERKFIAPCKNQRVNEQTDREREGRGERVYREKG